ncbi:helix-turn-helix domain-containing protein [Rhodovibrio sodomensis]|uniref:helix-turn-helix domain-containing protein n=1 Tax=Rhodovibrio sodomensis TaxID=1088 RepID=UPI0019081606|nr:helix-turn-helix domain-containing protein [Rhodovibrio sodomensis]
MPENADFPRQGRYALKEEALRSFTGRFGIVPAAWLEHPDIGLGEISVLTSLSTFADQDGWCHPSQGRIAKQLDRSRQWVNGILAKLVKIGLVEKHRRFSASGAELSAIYRIRYDAGLPDQPAAPDPNTDSPPVSQSTPPVSGLTPPVSGLTPPVDMSTPPVSPPDTNNTTRTESLSGGRARGGSKIEGKGGDEKTVPPEDWRPSDDDIAWIQQRHPDIDPHAFAEQFALSCQANGYRYRNHSAAYRHWVIEHAGRVDREDKRRGGADRNAPGHGSKEGIGNDGHNGNAQRRGGGGRKSDADRVQRNAERASAVLDRLHGRSQEPPVDDPASAQRRAGSGGERRA